MYTSQARHGQANVKSQSQDTATKTAQHKNKTHAWHGMAWHGHTANHCITPKSRGRTRVFSLGMPWALLSCRSNIPRVLLARACASLAQTSENGGMTPPHASENSVYTSCGRTSSVTRGAHSAPPCMFPPPVTTTPHARGIARPTALFAGSPGAVAHTLVAWLWLGLHERRSAGVAPARAPCTAA